MSESMGSGTGDVSGNDKLLSAVSYLFPLIGLILLFTDMKNKPFVKFHAVQSMAFGLVNWGVYFIFATVTFGIGSICFPVFFFPPLWPAFKAFQGELVEVPVMTGLLKKQGWV